MSRLEEALVPFKETISEQTSLPVSWDWRTSKDERTAALLGEFRMLYEGIVEKYDFNVLSALMGHLSGRKDKAIWNPYFWEHWQKELTAAAKSYAERGSSIEDTDEKRAIFDEVTAGLAEVVELANHEPGREFERELLRWLDEKCNVVRRERFY